MYNKQDTSVRKGVSASFSAGDVITAIVQQPSKHSLGTASYPSDRLGGML